jgi:FkbM family methyltransferase
LTENLKVAIKTEHAFVEFVMTFDPTFMPDRAMRLCLERDRSCEPELTHLLARVVKPGDVVIDGGANVGFFTCLLSRLVGPGGRVYAIEPTPLNIAKIKQNLANNAMQNVELVEQALSDAVGTATLHLSSDTGSNSLTRHSESVGAIQVPTTTLDTLIPQAFPRLIKLDIEGYEGHALLGAPKVLERASYVVCEANYQALPRCGWSIARLRECLRNSGFYTFVLLDDGSHPLFVPDGTKLITQKLNRMLLFSRMESMTLAWPEMVCD